MTQTTENKTGKSKLADAKKKLGKKAEAAQTTEAAPAPTETPMYGVVEAAICEETGVAYAVGDWVGYLIGSEEMTGQILTMKTQAPPFETVVEVPNHQKADQPWTKTLSELQPAQIPDADNPFPVSEAEIDAAIGGASAPELTPVDVVAVPVLPLGDALTPAQDVTPILDGSSSGVFQLDQLIASPLNPRKQFEQSAIAELAESILHKGLMQNLVGRVAENGQDVEVVAGGRRLRALKLLAEQGRIPSDHPVPVRVQPLTDLEALQLATAENVERRNMTALEEADAFAKMVTLGATPEDIALRFGYSGRTVAQRLVLAEGLGEDGRKLFEDGQIGLGQAQVIAQVTGPLRKHIVSEAGRGVGIQGLTSLIKRGSFLVEHARFDVPASGLEIVEDLYHSEPARFANPKAALAQQLDWVKARAKELESKKEQHFVEVRKFDREYLNLPYEEFTTYDVPKELFGTVIMVSTVTGEIKDIRAARSSDAKSYQAKKQAEERKKTSAEAVGSEGGTIRKSGWVDGHEARATALRSGLVGDHKRTVALTILSMLEAEPVSLRGSLAHVQAVAIPLGIRRLQEIDAQVGGALKVNGHHTPKHPLGVKFGHSREGETEYVFLQTLLTLTLEELLDVQGVLISQAVGGWSDYNPIHAAYPFVARLAADVSAQVTFKLTDEHLKAYPRDRLLELAADADLAHSHGLEGDLSKLATNKDIRAAILEHADALAERGYVPPIARFPELAPLVPAESKESLDEAAETAAD